MYGCGASCKEGAEYIPVYLAALGVFLYPVGFVAQVYAPQVGVFAVSLGKGDHIAVYVGLCALFAADHSAEVLVARIAVLEVVKGQKCSHDVDVVLLSQLKELVQIRPVLAGNGLENAVLIHL